MHLVKEVEPLTLCLGLDSCLLLQLEEHFGSIQTNLSNITQDILSSKNEDKEQLDKKDIIRRTLFELSLHIKCLLHDQLSSPSLLESESQVKLPEIDVFMLDGNILRWNILWEQF